MNRLLVRRDPHDPERTAAEYVAGELEPRRIERFEAHLLECEDCWREVVLDRIGRRVAEGDRVAPPVGLRDRIRAAVQATGELGAGRRPRRRRRRP